MLPPFFRRTRLYSAYLYGIQILCVRVNQYHCRLSSLSLVIARVVFLRLYFFLPTTRKLSVREYEVNFNRIFPSVGFYCSCLADQRYSRLFNSFCFPLELSFSVKKKKRPPSWHSWRSLQTYVNLLFLIVYRAIVGTFLSVYLTRGNFIPFESTLARTLHGPFQPLLSTWPPALKTYSRSLFSFTASSNSRWPVT